CTRRASFLCLAPHRESAIAFTYRADMRVLRRTSRELLPYFLSPPGDLRYKDSQAQSRCEAAKRDDFYDDDFSTRVPDCRSWRPRYVTYSRGADASRAPEPRCASESGGRMAGRTGAGTAATESAPG